MLEIIKYYNMLNSIAGGKIPLVIMLSLLATLLESAGIALLFPLLEMLISSDQSQHEVPYYLVWLVNKLEIYYLITIFLTIFILKSLLYYITQVLILKIRIDFLNESTQKINSIISNSSINYFQQYKPGYFSAILNENIPRVGEALTFFATTISSIATSIILLVLILTLNFRVMFIILILAIPLWYLYRYINKKISHLSSYFNIKKIAYTEAIHDLTESHLYSKLINYSGAFELKKNTLAKAYFDIQKNINKMHVLSLSLREPILLIVLVCLIYGLQNITYTATSVSVTIVFYLYRCVNSAYNAQISAQVFLEKVGFLQEIIELQNNRDEKFLGRQTSELIPFESEIKFDRIYIRSPEKFSDQNEINLKIKCGEYIKVSGKSGAGKSTFLNMLALLLKPYSGEIVVDGKKISIQENNQWACPIGAVTQDVRLFNETLRFNLTLKNDKVKTDEEIFRILEQVNLDYVAIQSIDGLDAKIGNGGRILSGGEKQRLLIARELLREPKILLLDEPTSALDADSVKLIEKVINSLVDVTVIFVTHSETSGIRYDKELRL